MKSAETAVFLALIKSGKPWKEAMVLAKVSRSTAYRWAKILRLREHSLTQNK
jgi:hypothetical protein